VNLRDVMLLLVGAGLIVMLAWFYYCWLERRVVYQRWLDEKSEMQDEPCLEWLVGAKCEPSVGPYVAGCWSLFGFQVVAVRISNSITLKILLTLLISQVHIAQLIFLLLIGK
jgi:hypothetical protein